MKVLSIVSEKGGVGKTTVAVHLAVAARLAGLDTAIVDLDPQASAADWSDARGEAPEAVTIPPSRLEKPGSFDSDYFRFHYMPGRG